MPNTKIWALIAKKLSGEASIEELGELERLLKANPEMHYPMQTVADLWHHASPETEEGQLAFARHTDRLKNMGVDFPTAAVPGYTGDVPSKRKKYLAILVVIALAGIGYFSWPQLFPSKASAKTLADKSEISTKYGSRTKLQLPDGSQVWLNSGSKLSYDKSYGNGLREVALSGEAYFDVVKNPAQPFIIHTTSIDIKVLGTAFNVKSFPGEKNTETSLIRGSIEVTIRNQPTKKIILQPNEKLITANEDAVLPVATINPANTSNPVIPKDAAPQEPMVQVSHLTYEPRDSTVVETSWMDNKLIFRSETFEDLSVKMERWYGVTIRFADDAIKPKKLNGTFENESIQQALQALQLITPFSYKINKTEILIASK
ncbi:MAG: FecR domain-containing protein [Chitinophagaceae bacterium]